MVATRLSSRMLAEGLGLVGEPAPVIGTDERVIADAPGRFDVRERFHRERVTYRRHDHEHPSTFIVLSGRVDERAGPRAIECEAGAVGFIPAEATHESRFAEGAVHTLNITLDRHWLECSGVTIASAREPVYASGARMSAVALRLRRACAGRGPDRAGEVEELVLALLDAAGRRGGALSAGERGELDRAPEWLDTAVELIRASPDPAGDLAEIARVVERHPAHVCRVFRSALGCTISEFSRGVRVGRAAMLLRTSRRTLSQIAFETGFSDQAHLTRWFGRVMGTSPRAYRSARS